MREQVQIAMDIADVIIFLTDIKQGVTEADKDIALLLKKTKKPIVLVCNKADKFEKERNEIYEFYNLGIGDPLAVSAVNASGIGDVLDEVYNHFKEENKKEEDEEYIKVALIGKPNVRKILTNKQNTRRKQSNSKRHSRHNKRRNR